MDEGWQDTGPDFLHGTEVARYRPVPQPGFEAQLSLLERDLELKKKLQIALIVIVSVFFAGLVAGAVMGIFV